MADGKSECVFLVFHQGMYYTCTIRECAVKASIMIRENRKGREREEYENNNSGI